VRAYRSAIFSVDDEQRRVAEDTIADVEASGLWPGKVVTEVVPPGSFWEPEPQALGRIPNGYTCHFVRPDWGTCCLAGRYRGQIGAVTFV
jgi:peptide-methionine (S)-S-oxide reductase